MSKVISERLADIKALVLSRGNHDDPSVGMCVMEAVAYVAGENFSDHPDCTSPVISAFMRRWNDDLDDETRQRLKPYIPRLVSTRGTKAVENRRAWLVTDWLVRVHTPAWLELGGMKEQAEALRGLPSLESAATARESQPTIDVARTKADAARAAARAAAWDAARAAAWDAARAAAGDAAWAAAWAAVWDAARAAAWDAARAAAWAAAWAAARDAARAAAWDAARVAAGDAAGAAAWAAARVAAGKCLEPTKVSLQESAFALLDRLIEGK